MEGGRKFKVECCSDKRQEEARHGVCTVEKRKKEVGSCWLLAKKSRLSKRESLQKQLTFSEVMAYTL